MCVWVCVCVSSVCILLGDTQYCHYSTFQARVTRHGLIHHSMQYGLNATVALAAVSVASSVKI